jgi:hypothetical protein
VRWLCACALYQAMRIKGAGIEQKETEAQDQEAEEKD